MADARMGTTYDRLKAMAVGFEMKPGDRLNEVALAHDLGVSRTPLREALNRLVAERLFDFKPGTGFFCRGLDAQGIFDLYEMRKIIELAAARLAVERADQASLEALNADLYARGLSVAGLTVAEACARDEEFHIGIARAAGNAELTRSLEQLNDRLRFIRWVRMAGARIAQSKEEHKAIMDALLRRDVDAATRALSGHIESRRAQLTDAVREGITNIYMEPGGALAARVLTEAAP